VGAPNPKEGAWEPDVVVEPNPNDGAEDDVVEAYP